GHHRRGVPGDHPLDDRHEGRGMSGRRMYGGLHLLDRQIVDVDGSFAGKVDDVELEESDEGGVWHVTAILSGAGALGPRIGGRFGRFLAALNRRLSDEATPA